MKIIIRDDKIEKENHRDRFLIPCTINIKVICLNHTSTIE